MAFKSYKFRLYPTKAQVAQLEQHCGSVRFVWNHMLAKNIESHNESGKFIFANEMQKELLELKKKKTHGYHQLIANLFKLSVGVWIQL